jgi:hypothetical protein
MAWDSFFNRDYTNIQDMVHSVVKISGRQDAQWIQDSLKPIDEWIKRNGNYCKQYPQTIGYNPFCENWQIIHEEINNINNPRGELADALDDYIRSREFQYTSYNANFLKDCHDKLAKYLLHASNDDKKYWVTLLFKLMEIYTMEGRSQELADLLAWSLNNGHITDLGRKKAIENFNYFQKVLGNPVASGQ